MNDHNIEEKLQKHMISDVKVASYSRRFVLFALLLVGIAIYGIWRVKNPSAPPPSTVPATVDDSESLPALGLANDFGSVANDGSPVAAPLSLEAVLGDGDQNLPTANAPAAPVSDAAATQSVIDEFSVDTATSERSGRATPNFADGNDPAFDYFSGAATGGESRANSSANSATSPNSSRRNSRGNSPVISDANSLVGTSAGAPRSENERVHIIKDEESLPELAARYYGSATAENIRRIRNANPQLRHGGFREGVPLKIPLAENEVEFSATVGSSDAGRRYAVETGDTLSAIAAKTLGAANRWREIFDLNRDQLSAPENLRAGMKIKLPAK